MLPAIAVIDDDASVRAATDNLLARTGYLVHTFPSAEEFLRSTQLDESSCVIADVQMPVISGLDLLTHLRTLGNNTPFIFITAFPRRECPRPSIASRGHLLAGEAVFGSRVDRLC